MHLTSNKSCTIRFPWRRGGGISNVISVNNKLWQTLALNSFSVTSKMLLNHVYIYIINYMFSIKNQHITFYSAIFSNDDVIWAFWKLILFPFLLVTERLFAAGGGLMFNIYLFFNPLCSFWIFIKCI